MSWNECCRRSDQQSAGSFRRSDQVQRIGELPGEPRCGEESANRAEKRSNHSDDQTLCDDEPADGTFAPSERPDYSELRRTLPDVEDHHVRNSQYPQCDGHSNSDVVDSADLDGNRVS